VDGHAGGDFARLVAAHAVGEDGDANLGMHADGILVFGPHPTGIGQTGHGEVDHAFAGTFCALRHCSISCLAASPFGKRLSAFFCSSFLTIATISAGVSSRSLRMSGVGELAI